MLYCLRTMSIHTVIQRIFKKPIKRNTHDITTGFETHFSTKNNAIKHNHNWIDIFQVQHVE